MISIAVYTLEIAVFSTLVAAAIGIPLAFFCAKRTFAAKKLILAAGVVPLCIPPLIVALANVSFFGVNGFLADFLKLISNKSNSNFTLLYTTTGVVIVQGFYNFPLVTGILTDAWKELPEENENAARLLGTGEVRIFFTITLPRLAGAIGAACIPVFLYSYFSFMIVLLFSPVGHSTLEVEIYRSIRNTLQIKDGAILAIWETFSALIIVFFYGLISLKSQTSAQDINFAIKSSVKIGQRPYSTRSHKNWEIIIFTSLIFLVVLFFVCPAVSILISSFQQKRANILYFSFYQFKNLFSSKNFLAALFNSLRIGISTALCCCAVSFLYGAYIKYKHLESKVIFQTIPMLPMAISSVVVAWCFGLFFHKGNPVLLVIMQTLLYWPLAYRQIQNGINRISKETNNAALILSHTGFSGVTDILFRIYLPSCGREVRTAFGYCFAMSVGDATLPLVLSIPKFNTLAFYTYRLASSYRFNQACASAVVLAALCGTILLISKALPQWLGVLVERFGHKENQEYLQA